MVPRKFGFNIAFLLAHLMGPRYFLTFVLMSLHPGGDGEHPHFGPGFAETIPGWLRVEKMS